MARRVLRPAAAGAPGGAGEAARDGGAEKSAAVSVAARGAQGAAKSRDAASLEGMLDALKMDDFERELATQSEDMDAEKERDERSNGVSALQMFLGGTSEGEVPTLDAISSLLDDSDLPKMSALRGHPELLSTDTDDSGEVKVLVPTRGVLKTPRGGDEEEDEGPVSDGFDSDGDSDDYEVGVAVVGPNDGSTAMERYLGLASADGPSATAGIAAASQANTEVAEDDGSAASEDLKSDGIEDDDEEGDDEDDPFGVDEDGEFDTFEDDEEGEEETGAAGGAPTSFLDLGQGTAGKPLKFKPKAVRGNRNRPAASAAAAEAAESFEDIKDAFFDGGATETPPRKTKLQPGAGASGTTRSGNGSARPPNATGATGPADKRKGRAKLAPRAAAKGAVDVQNLIVENDFASPVSTAALAPSSPTSSDSDASVKKISIDEYLERERRGAQAQQFAAMRVQRHIQERIYILRQRRRMQMGLLDVLSESADEEDETSSDADSARDDEVGDGRTAGFDERPSSRSVVGAAWAAEALKSGVSPTAAGRMTGWLLKRQRTTFRMRGQRGQPTQSSKWDWRYFEFRGHELTWRKTNPEGMAPGTDVVGSPPITAHRRTPSGLTRPLSGRMGSFRGLGSSGHGPRDEDEADAPGEMPGKANAAASGAWQSPPAELLRLMMQEERIRNLAGPPDRSLPALDRPSPSIDEETTSASGEMTEAVDVNCNGRAAAPARASALDLRGLVVVLPEGDYEDLDPDLDWPKYHLQLFQEPETWYDGWTADARPILELWAPCYEDYLSWIRSLERAASLDPTSRSVAGRQRPAYLPRPNREEAAQTR